MAISLGPSGLNINGTIVDGPEDLGAPTTHNAVGSYGIFHWNTNNVSGPAVGSTTSASNISYSAARNGSPSTDVAQSGWHVYQGSMYRGGSHNGISYTTPSGTWRNMGIGAQARVNDDKTYSLWVRTA